MQAKFNQDEISLIENKIHEIERITGIELKLAILNQSDPYPGAIHRYCFILTVIIMLIVDLCVFMTATQMLLSLVVMYMGLYLSAPYSFLTNFFLTQEEKNREVKEKAFELFYVHGLNNTIDQIGMIILISFKERKIELVVDKGLSQHLVKSDLDELILSMREEFKKKEFSKGVMNTLKILEDKLVHKLEKRVKTDHVNELSNAIIWG
jgi:putative membrane protein